MNVIMDEHQCKTINAYFRGASILLPMIIMIVGLIVISIIGTILEQPAFTYTLWLLDIVGCRSTKLLLTSKSR